MAGKVRSKSELAIILSKFEDFAEQKIELEQYSTPSEIAAAILWDAKMRGDIDGKTVLDAASGPGYFGIGALLLGARKAFLVDINKDAIEISKRNYTAVAGNFEIGEAVFVNKSIEEFNEAVDVVVENPPFGTKKKHIDKVFLEKAFQSAPVVYTIHKITSKKFIEAICDDFRYEIKMLVEFDFPLKATQEFHKKKRYAVKAGLWKLARKP